MDDRGLVRHPRLGWGVEGLLLGAICQVATGLLDHCALGRLERHRHEDLVDLRLGHRLAVAVDGPAHKGGVQDAAGKKKGGRLGAGLEEQRDERREAGEMEGHLGEAQRDCSASAACHQCTARQWQERR